jgi:hypothetical protein
VESNIRIFFCGSHGTGKTTQLDHFRNLHPEFHRVESNRRDLVERGIIRVNREAAPWDEIVIGGDVMQHLLSTPAPSISDRSWVDKCAYAQLLPFSEEIKQAMHVYYSAAWYGQAENDLYFLFPTGVIPLEDDGVRSTDINYQLDVEYWIQYYLDYFNVDYYVIQQEHVQDRYLEIKEVLDFYGTN